MIRVHPFATSDSSTPRRPGASISATTGAIDPGSLGPLGALLTLLKRKAYRFVTPTPATHARILAREPGRIAADLRDVFGWSLPFAQDVIGEDLLRLLREADMVEDLPTGLARARLRVSSLGEDLFLHSAYPTDTADSVFFGPDSYRFADLIGAELSARPVRPGACIFDIGTGAGVGASVASSLSPGASIFMTDVNARALHFASINLAVAGRHALAVHLDGLRDIAVPVDLGLINPPYLMDADVRAYRDGGGQLGAEVALSLVGQCLDRLSPDGRIILYTGSAIVAGVDGLRNSLERLARANRCRLRYRELDPDVFGEELEGEAYRAVERIALVAASLERV
ncbi:hypothetical protein FHS95_001916 [Sphingomonas naasensis]|uniref:Methyltransferase n=1 Tax=Sphingomonas naasensis TaxID=1344951 RepID=A0A4S1WQI1_9SPHN|nr:methyltransferase [Sphingomonas naasensis]NIJ20224.1 hypothetical protein [Sphingomonas naasensis]TGX44367.1 methyltransferase [Sphingomonas naasensis]